MKRFAVYYAPRQGEFAARTAAWLGWDAASGREVARPDLPGLPCHAAEITRDPRKYGFHGTIRAPFRQLIDSVQSYYDPGRLIERNLPALMEAQEQQGGAPAQQPPAPTGATPPVQPPESDDRP